MDEVTRIANIIITVTEKVKPENFKSKEEVKNTIKKMVDECVESYDDLQIEVQDFIREGV